MTKPIRVLHCVVGSMNVGGIENMLMQMYREIDRDRIQFDFLVHDYKENYYEKEINELGGKVYRIPYLSKAPLKHIQEFREFLRNHPEYQIIHIHTTYSIMLSDAKEAKKQGRTVIIHSHNSSANTKRKLFHNVFKNKFSQTADYRVACSDLAGEWMFPQKDLDSVMFWPNAKRLEKYQYNQEIRNKIRAEENVEDAFVIGNVGRLSYQKNQELMIEVFDKLVQQKPNAVLWLIGDGEDRQKLEKLVADKNLATKVKFFGNRDNVNELLFAMDTFVLTSRYEGLGIVLLEAQATGLPIVIPAYIPEQACVTSSVSVIEDTQDLNEWVKAINEIKEPNRAEQFEIIYHTDFNISHWITKVMDFYEQIN